MLWPTDVDVKTPLGGGRPADAVTAAGLAAFPHFTLRRVARTPSTQDLVRTAARAGAPEGWCCLATEQTAGRGRQGRPWTAPPGTALLVSILLLPEARVLAGVPFACGLAVVDAVTAVAGVRIGLKWPNDVLADDGGKLAGILVEVDRRGSPGPHAVCQATAGLGLNLHIDAFPPSIAGASLHRLAKRVISTDEALAALLTTLGTRMHDLRANGVPATVAAWRAHAVGLGLPVAVQTPSGRLDGTALDIRDDGALLLLTASGETVPVFAGDVHLIPPHPPNSV